MSSDVFFFFLLLISDSSGCWSLPNMDDLMTSQIWPGFWVELLKARQYKKMFFLPTAFEIFEMSTDVPIKFEPFSQFCHPPYQPSQIWNKTVRQWMVFITEHREENSPCSPTKQLHLYLQTSRGGTRDAWWAAICQQTNPHLCVATQLPSAAARLLCEKTWAE